MARRIEMQTVYNLLISTDGNGHTDEQKAMTEWYRLLPDDDRHRITAAIANVCTYMYQKAQNFWIIDGLELVAKVLLSDLLHPAIEMTWEYLSTGATVTTRLPAHYPEEQIAALKAQMNEDGFALLEIKTLS